MKSITKFQASDGALFDTESEARARDALQIRLAEIEQPLGPRVERSGLRRIHKVVVFQGLKRSLMAICRELYPKDAVFQADPLSVHPFSYAGRLVCDGGPTILAQAWNRLMCITEDGVEYEQPYFALNPERWTDSDELLLCPECGPLNRTGA